MYKILEFLLEQISLSRTDYVKTFHILSAVLKHLEVPIMLTIAV